MAVMATCAQVAPINPFLTPSELKKQLGDVQACAIVSDKLSEEKAAGVAAQFDIPTRLTLGRRRHDARRVEGRQVARARSLAAAEARRFRAADLHGRLDGRAEGRQSHASRAALLGAAARDRLAVQVRRGAIPERRADVSHLGARLFDARCRSTRRARSSWCRATTPTRSCRGSPITRSRCSPAVPRRSTWAC